MANINKIRLSGQTYDIQDPNAQPLLTAGQGITIENNVISATEGGGGGKAVSGGTNISITSGETADTINCTLPIKTNAWGSLTFNSSRNPSQVLYASAFGDYTTASGKGSFAIGIDTTASGEYSFVGGYNSSQAKGANSFSFGDGTIANKNASVAFGQSVTTNNQCEFSCGKLNKSVLTSPTFGDSGNTLFSVGNGMSTYHNAFEIKQNGDIYITLNDQDVKLQDHLGGGGGGGITSGEVQTMIDESISGKADTSSLATVATSGSYDDLTNKPTIPTVPTSNTAFTNDAGYITSNDITGKTDTTAFTAHTADTTIHVTTAQTAAWNAKSDFSGSYNDLTNKLSAGTNISIVDNVISATGGGGGMTEDDELLLSTALTDLNDRKIDASEVKSNYQKKGDYVTTSTLNTRLADYETALDEQNVEEVTAYALNDLNERFGGLKIVKITETEYAALTTKDENTLYIVVADPS